MPTTRSLGAAALVVIVATTSTLHARRGGECCPGSVRINEIRIDHPSVNDPQEYVELRGDPLTPLVCMYYLVLGPGGVVEQVFGFGGLVIGPTGFVLIAQPSFNAAAFPGGATPDVVIPLGFVDGGNRTHLLVCACEGLPGIAAGLDLDPDDDGDFDAAPWSCIIDAIGLIQDPLGPVTYGAVTRGPTAGGNSPEHVYRCRTPLPLGPWRMGVAPLPSGGGLDSPDLPNPFCPSLTAFGVDHFALGESALSFDSGVLVASPIDASGEDGMLSIFPPSLVWHAIQNTPAGADGVEPGDAATVRAWGRVAGILRPIAAHTLSRPSETVVAMTAHFGLLPADAPLVGEVLNGAEVVGSVTFPNQSSFLAEFSGSPVKTWGNIEWIYRAYLDSGPLVEDNAGLPVPIAAWDMPMDSIMPILMAGQVFIGDTVRVRTADPVPTSDLWEITAVETTGVGLGFGAIETNQEILERGVLFGQLPHLALGQASLERNADELVASSIGQSGDDGIGIVLGSARSWQSSFVAGGLQPNASIMLEAKDAEGVPQCAFVVSESGQGSELNANFPGNAALAIDAWIDGVAGYTTVIVPPNIPIANFDICPFVFQLRFTLDHAPTVDPTNPSSPQGNELAATFGFDGPPQATTLGDSVVVNANRFRVHPPFFADSRGGGSGSTASVAITAEGISSLTLLETVAEGSAPPPPACPSDLNGDGTVSGGDLAILLGAWNSGGGSTSPADINGDGSVDAADLALLLGGWGACPG